MFPDMLPIRNISYLLPMCCSFWEKCKNSPKTGLGCSTPLTKSFYMGSYIPHLVESARNHSLYMYMRVGVACMAPNWMLGVGVITQPARNYNKWAMPSSNSNPVSYWVTGKPYENSSHELAKLSSLFSAFRKCLELQNWYQNVLLCL